MSDTAVTFAIYAGLGLVVAVLIFVGALWFANSAKKGNLRFKRMQRRDEARRGGRPDRPTGPVSSSMAAPPPAREAEHE